MFRSVRTYLLLLLLGYLLCGCSHTRSYAPQLDRAEILMEERPDSSFTLLSTIPADSLRRDEKARYALLLYQSRHKTERPNTSDSLINIAVDRYSRKGPDSLLMKSLFYRAETYMELNRLPESITDATHAFDLASSANNHYWKAKSAELIADLLQSTNNFHQEAQWRRTLVEEYRLAGRTANEMFGLCDLLTATSNSRDTILVNHLIDSIAPLIQHNSGIPFLEAYFNTTLMPYYYYVGRRDRADSLYNCIIRVPGYPISPEILLEKAQIEIDNGNFQYASDILIQIESVLETQNQKDKFFATQISYYENQGHFKEAAALRDSLSLLHFRILRDALAQPVAEAQSAYYNRQKEEERLRHFKTRRNLSISLGVIILLAIFAGIYHLYKRKVYRRELENKIKDIIIISREVDRLLLQTNAMQADIQNKTEKIEKYREIIVTDKNDLESHRRKIETDGKTIRRQNRTIRKLENQLSEREYQNRDLFLSKWNLLSDLCQTYFQLDSELRAKSSDKDNADTETQTLMRSIKMELLKLKDPSLYRELEEKLNLSRNNLIRRLREQCPQLDEKDYLIVTLLNSGFSMYAVSFFTDLKIASCYSRRNRIKGKIEKINPTDAEEFIASIVSVSAMAH